MGRNPLPSNQSLKLFLPRESQEEKLLRQGHSTHQTHWKKPGDTGNSCDTKKAGNSFCLKRVKTAILFRRISLWDFFFFSCPNIPLVHTGETLDSGNTSSNRSRHFLRSLGIGSDGGQPGGLCRGRWLLCVCSPHPHFHGPNLSRCRGEAGRQT